MAESPLPYNPVSTKAWIEAVEKAARWEARGGDEWLLVAECPNCHHTLSKLVAHGAAVPGAAISAEKTVAKKELRVVVACNCPYPHAGQAAVGDGCGFYGRLTLEVTADDELGASP